jgi:hypothetical protein
LTPGQLIFPNEETLAHPRVHRVDAMPGIARGPGDVRTDQTEMKTYIIQLWDSDTESWEDWDDLPPCSSRAEAESEARQEASKCAHRVRWRVKECE